MPHERRASHTRQVLPIRRIASAAKQSPSRLHMRRHVRRRSFGAEVSWQDEITSAGVGSARNVCVLRKCKKFQHSASKLIPVMRYRRFICELSSGGSTFSHFVTTAAGTSSGLEPMSGTACIFSMIMWCCLWRAIASCSIPSMPSHRCGDARNPAIHWQNTIAHA